MLNVPLHLLQTLSVDTNISYDLDMSMFPGLDDPHQMYEPALLIATDWSQYVYSDEDVFTSTYEEVISPPDKELLHETVSSDFVSYIDPQTFQYLIDDVTRDPLSSSECFTFLETCAESSAFSSDLSASSASSMDSMDLSDFSPRSPECVVEVDQCDSKDVLSPFDQCHRGQKRPWLDTYTETTKKIKMVDMLTSSPTCPVSVCPVYNHSVFDRGS